MLFATLEPHDTQAEFFGDLASLFGAKHEQGGGVAVGLGGG